MGIEVDFQTNLSALFDVGIDRRLPYLYICNFGGKNLLVVTLTVHHFVEYDN